MKKTYIIPSFKLTTMGCETLIAESITVNGDNTTSGTSGGWVKEDNNSQSRYNVWDDDWSN